MCIHIHMHSNYTIHTNTSSVLKWLYFVNTFTKYVHILVYTCNMNIKKVICTFWNLKNGYLFGMHLQIFAIVCICMCHCKQYFFMPKLHANTCNTSKYCQDKCKYVHMHLQQCTFKGMVQSSPDGTRGNIPRMWESGTTYRTG